METLKAIQAIRYPHTTWLCDEANDPYLIEICKELGVRHVTRNNRKDAKAGNINNALQYASGELCVVMDPDHVPTPDFLDHIVPHFNNPEVGFVQIVQAYSNLDDSLVAKGAAQQTFQFYGPIMATMNSYGTVLAIGANCTFRGSAGFHRRHASGLAEDMHTAMHFARERLEIGLRAGRADTRPGALHPLRLLCPATEMGQGHAGIACHFLSAAVQTFHLAAKAALWHYSISLPGWHLFLHQFPHPCSFVTDRPDPFPRRYHSIFALAWDVAGLFRFPLILDPSILTQWVMEETERGFHVVGGLLLIGTWWIYILGLVYTLIRKKVPYIPTPKDDSEPDNWKLNIPNIAVLLISLGAIIYGLS